MSDEKDTAERAKELLVYGPLGLALFLRDNGPQFLRMFVARGRNEVDQRRREVGEQLDHVRSTGESATADGGPEMLRVVSNALGALRERAEEALQALGVRTDDADEDGNEPAPPFASSPTPTTAEANDVSVAPAPAPADLADDLLAIPGYDDLSASQIVDRLDGLSRDELEAIRSHEAAHRGRNTVLGKIEQLTRGT
jgi:hypothetical protein